MSQTCLQPEHKNVSHFGAARGSASVCWKWKLPPKMIALKTRHYSYNYVDFFFFRRTHISQNLPLPLNKKKISFFNFSRFFMCTYTLTHIRQWFFILEDLCQNKSRVIEWKGFFFSVPVYYYYPRAWASISSSQSQ